MPAKLVGCEDTGWYALYTKTSTNPRERTPSNASDTLFESEQSIRIANTCAFSSLAISSANLDNLPKKLYVYTPRPIISNKLEKKWKTQKQNNCLICMKSLDPSLPCYLNYSK